VHTVHKWCSGVPYPHEDCGIACLTDICFLPLELIKDHQMQSESGSIGPRAFVELQCNCSDNDTLTPSYRICTCIPLTITRTCSQSL